MKNDVVLLVLAFLAFWLLTKNNTQQQITNEESWTWTDYKGQERSIVVNRHVSATN